MINWLIEKYIQRKWSQKADSQIIYAYQDAIDWLKLDPKWFDGSLKAIQKDAQNRLDNYIMPQIKKRNLTILVVKGGFNDLRRTAR